MTAATPPGPATPGDAAPTRPVGLRPYRRTPQKGTDALIAAILRDEAVHLSFMGHLLPTNPPQETR